MKQSVATNDWEANWLASRKRESQRMDTETRIARLEAQLERVTAQLAEFTGYLEMDRKIG